MKPHPFEILQRRYERPLPRLPPTRHHHQLSRHLLILIAALFSSCLSRYISLNLKPSTNNLTLKRSRRFDRKILDRIRVGQQQNASPNHLYGKKLGTIRNRVAPFCESIIVKAQTCTQIIGRWNLNPLVSFWTHEFPVDVGDRVKITTAAIPLTAETYARHHYCPNKVGLTLYKILL